MKDFLRHQPEFDISHNFVQITLNYLESILPYIYFEQAHDNIVGIQKTLMQFVDGENFGNIHVLLENNYLKLINCILHLKPIMNECKSKKELKIERMENLKTLELHGQKYVDTDPNLQNFYNRINVPMKIIFHNYEALKKATDLQTLNRIFNLVLPPDVADYIELDKSKGDFLMQRQNQEAPKLLRQNLVISILKTKVVSILLDITSRSHKMTPQIYYDIIANIDPEVFRMNFCYLSVILDSHYHSKYEIELFNKLTKTSLIIEFGQFMYALLLRIKELSKDYQLDLEYQEKIFQHTPEEVRNDIDIQSGFFVQILHLTMKLIETMSVCFRENKKIYLDTLLTEQSLTKKLKEYMKIYADTTSQIDILIDGKIVGYTFTILPHCRLPSEQRMMDFIYSIDSTNTKSKCEGLMENSKALIKEMEFRYALKTNTTEVGKYVVKYEALWNQLMWFLTIAINIVVILSFDSKQGARLLNPKLGNLSQEETDAVLFFLGIFALFFWSMIYVPYFIITYMMKKYTTKMALDEEFVEQFKCLTSKKEIKKFKKSLKRKEYYLTVYEMVNDRMLMYLSILGASILVGLAYNYLAYSFMVTYLIVLSPSMRGLIHALWEPRLAIFSTLVLTILIIYMIVVVYYIEFSRYYPDNLWTNLWDCYIVSFDNSLRMSGIGQALNLSYDFTEGEDKMQVSKVLLDNFEWFLISLLMANIFSGIIIDKFGEIRENREKDIEDFSTSCFICGKSSKDFENYKETESYDTHVTFKHNVWDYVYFIAFLKYQESHKVMDMTHIEQHVLEQINKGDISWFPINEACSDE